MSRSLVPVAVSLAFLMTAAAARAQPVSRDAAARSHYARGKSLTAEKRFAEAYAEFEAGYAASGRPLFLFNMGECARESGDIERARAAYQRYLTEDPGGKLAATARERLAQLPGPPPSSTSASPPAPQDNAGPSPSRSASKEPPASQLEPAQPSAARPPAPLRLNRAESASPPSAETTLFARAERDVAEDRPIWGRWQLWAGVGAAVALGTIVLFATMNGGEDPACGVGCIDLR